MSGSAAARRVRAGLAALTCATALLGTALDAEAATPRLRQMRLAVQITGIQVLDWHRQDEGFPDPARVWIAGTGTQTLGFSTPKPVVYLASAFSGTLASGERLSPLALTPLHAPAPLTGSLRRRGSWRHGDGISCDREGGCDDGLVVPLHQKPSCPAKRLGVTAGLSTSSSRGDRIRDLVVLRSEAAIPSGLWSNCPPDMEGEHAQLLGLPAELVMPGATKRILGLGRGASVTLKAQVERGAANGAQTASCRTLSGVGFQQCSVTDVTVEIKRVG